MKKFIKYILLLDDWIGVIPTFLYHMQHHLLLPVPSEFCHISLQTFHLLIFLFQSPTNGVQLKDLATNKITFQIALTKALSVDTFAFFRGLTPGPIHVMKANFALRLISSPVSKRA